MRWLRKHGYEFTERGKITLALIAVIMLFIIPAVIIAVMAWRNVPAPINNETPPSNITETDSNGTNPNESDPIISNSPPPTETDSESEPEENESDNLQEHGNGEDYPQDNHESGEATIELPHCDIPEGIEVGPISINRTAGTMSFSFAPEYQNTLDDETMSMISDFITSPRNTPNSKLIIEIPNLPESDSQNLISALVDAFSPYGIRQDNISYVVNQSTYVESTVEVNLTFQTVTTQNDGK